MVRPGQRGTAEEQFENLRIPMAQIARLSRYYRVVITHGNGPQVGNLLLQQESAPEVPSLPLEILVAQTQGQIGYMIESTLDSELMRIGIDHARLVSLISYVVVGLADPAFDRPTKPIGPVYDAATVSSLKFPVVETADGYRRVVASPEPVSIVEKQEILELIQRDFIVICCGGGGIPVVRRNRAFAGVDAVIDKDRVSALLAQEIGAEVFVIATDVPGAAIDFGTPRQRYLEEVTLADLRNHLEKGSFDTGSMAPKVEAMIRYAEGPAGRRGGRVVITSLECIEEAVDRRAGTRTGGGEWGR